MKAKSDSFISKDMYHAVLKLVLLTKIRKEKTYSYKLLKDISKHLSPISGKKDIKSDIYNTINLLENAGYIKVDVQMERNRTKKYYSLTKEGIKVHDNAKMVFRDAMTEVSKFLPR